MRETDSAVGAAGELSAEAPENCLLIARTCAGKGDVQGALLWALRCADAAEDLPSWLAAAGVLRRFRQEFAEGAARHVRLAVLGSYTTSQLVALLPLAAGRHGISVEVYESPFDQIRQEILDPDSGLYAFAPDAVVLATHAGAAQLSKYAADPLADVETEAGHWAHLWRTIQERTGAHVIQHLFAIPPEEPLGHIAVGVPGSQRSQLQRLNLRLGELAVSAGVGIVDCELLAASRGKDRWFDPRYWFLAKQAVSLGSVPLLARHTGAVLAAAFGRSRKCLVVDLDNTLWGGVLGEEGISGIAVGEGPAGEAFASFQQYLAGLVRRGVLLAVCSKNDPEHAKSVFEQHPGMRLRLEDIAFFLAGWEDKATGLRRIAHALNLGLDALVFCDDNPAEREIVRQLLPEVDVIILPNDPAYYGRAVAAHPAFESVAITAEDGQRTAQYQARAKTKVLEESSSSIEEFLASLEMVATVSPLNEMSLPRVAQLVAKTNQFNLTGRRRSAQQLAELAAAPEWSSICVSLTDRFADHGLVAFMLLNQQGTALCIDTWLMSCRVIGRSLEHGMVGLAAQEADRRSCSSLMGWYVPTPRNGLVKDLYSQLGFRLEGGQGEHLQWSKPVDELVDVASFVTFPRAETLTSRGGD